MANDKNLLSGNTTMLVLKLLESGDKYGYQIIEELAQKSEEIFRLKTGTLYPILHGLERDGIVVSYDGSAGNNRIRKYYCLTKKGRGLLSKKHKEWTRYNKAVERIMNGGIGYVFSR